MVEVIAIFCLIINIISIIFSTIEISKHPWKISPILVILHGVFYIWPFYDFIFELNRLEYAYFEYFNLKPSTEYAVFYLFISSVCIFILSITSYANITFTSCEAKKKYEYSYSYFKVIFVILILVILVFFSARNFDGDLITFFTPARKAIDISGYERKLLFVLPCITLLIFRFCKAYTLFRFIVLAIICFAIVSILGQRRDLSALILFSTFLVMYYKLPNLNYSKKLQRRAGIILVICIPSLWYARSYFTQLGRGQDIINPFTLRNPIELIFGSSTTGFSSFFLQQKHLDSGAIEFLHSIKQLLGVAIPRIIYEDKISTIPQTIKFAEKDNGNISNFLINEFFINFQGFIFPIFLFFAITINEFYKKSVDVVGNITPMYFFCFANIILLFKNGWSDFIVTIMMFYILFFILSKSFSYKT